MLKTLKFERQEFKVALLLNKTLSWAGIWENGTKILRILNNKTKVDVLSAWYFTSITHGTDECKGSSSGQDAVEKNTGMRRITTFRSTADSTKDDGPTRL